MSFVPLISEDANMDLCKMWKNVENTKDLVLVLVRNLVKLAQEEDLYEAFKKRIKVKDLLEVDLYGYNTVHYTMDKKMYALSHEAGGLFQKTVGELGDEYVTKASRLSDIFLKNPRDIVINSKGKEYSLHWLLDNTEILLILSAHLGDNCWVSVRNVDKFEFNGFYVSCNSIYVTYMPEGLQPHMIQARDNALKRYGLVNIDGMPPLISTDSCNKACHCEY